MKSLRNLLWAIPLMCTLGCPPIVIPNPVVQNNPPVANLSVSPLSGYASSETKTLETNISLTGTDPDEDAVTGYKVKIDIGDDGTIDETIPADGSFSPEPIDTTREFGEGKIRIYGQCKDERESTSNKTNSLVMVYKPNENKLPIANFFVSRASGQYPFTTAISLDGEDSDGTVTGYKVEIDKDSDGKVDETIPADGSFSPEPINITKEFGFEDIGSLTICGIIKDDKDGKTIESRNVTVNGRTDLSTEINFEAYQTGSPFDFVGQVKNAITKDIFIDNSNLDSLEYKLVQEGNKTPVFNKKFDQKSEITLYNQGYLKLKSEGNKLWFSFCNATLSILGLSKTSYSETIPIGVSSPAYIFKESGKYHLEILVKYLIDKTEYKQKFVYPQFEVE